MSLKVLEQNEKKGWIDFTKCIATFMVLFQHSTSNIWTTTLPEESLWKCVHLPFIFSRIAVLLFFMCSGCTMLSKKRNISDILTKNVFGIFKVYVSWMLVYGAVSCINLYQEGLASYRTCMNAIVKAIIFGKYHTWFIFALISLYLITPFLQMIVQNKKYMEYFLVLSFLFSVIMPILHNIDDSGRLSSTLDSFNMNFVLGYVLYYVAGYCISNMEWQKKYVIMSVVLFCLSLGITCGVTFKQSLQMGRATQEVFGEFSILAFLTTVSFFGIMRSMENVKFPRWVPQIVFLGFGIYLMHPLLLKHIVAVRGFNIFMVIPLFYLFCVLVCWGISKNKLLSKLFLK